MKRILIIIIGVILLSSCSKKWCNEHYPCIDSTYIKEVVKIDTTWLKLPADTTYIELPFDCPDQQIIYRDGKKETKIVVRDKKIYINYTTPEDSLRIINLFKNSSEFKQAVKEVPVSVPYIPNWVYWAIGISVLSLIYTFRKYIISFFRLISKLV